MSELIDNSNQRQARLKELIQALHRGEDKEKITAIFKQEFKSVTGAEIAAMEYNLVQEGVSIEEIQSLCDVHASLFQGSVANLHSNQLTINPIVEFQQENNLYSTCTKKAKQVIANETDYPILFEFVEHFKEHFDMILEHYSKKEHILFPYLEKRGINTIPQVMWGVDNQIRDAIKDVYTINQPNHKDLKLAFEKAINMVDEMITKEDHILFPMLLEQLQQEELIEISKTLDDNEYQRPVEHLDTAKNVSNDIPMSMGRLNAQEINAIFNTVPYDMTFVDADNKVKFVTQGKERIFDRPISVINRSVELCHPPQSVSVVMDIVDDLRSGKKDHEDFWLNFRGKMVHIRYYAVRNAQGEYLGTLEVTQNITEIQQLTGEKRLVSA